MAQTYISSRNQTVVVICIYKPRVNCQPGNVGYSTGPKGPKNPQFHCMLGYFYYIQICKRICTFKNKERSICVCLFPVVRPCLRAHFKGVVI